VDAFLIGVLPLLVMSIKSIRVLELEDAIENERGELVPGLRSDGRRRLRYRYPARSALASVARRSVIARSRTGNPRHSGSRGMGSFRRNRFETRLNNGEPQADPKLGLANLEVSNILLVSGGRYGLHACCQQHKIDSENRMNKLATAAAIAALLGASASASAWWGPGYGGYGPGYGSGLGDAMGDMFGDGYGDFNFGMSGGGSGRGYGRGLGRGYGYGYNNPYYGYGAPYYGGGYPYAYPYAAPVAPMAPVAPAQPEAK
jgi:hypothetical protein